MSKVKIITNFHLLICCFAENISFKRQHFLLGLSKKKKEKKEKMQHSLLDNHAFLCQKIKKNKENGGMILLPILVIMLPFDLFHILTTRLCAVNNYALFQIPRIQWNFCSVFFHLS